MKRVEMAKDYAEFLIRSKFVITNIEKAMNKRDFDVAKFMAHELKITAMLLQDAIDRHEIKVTQSQD
jgi:ribosome-binding protein aMBF1 (putative translation factor)